MLALYDLAENNINYRDDFAVGTVCFAKLCKNSCEKMPDQRQRHKKRKNCNDDLPFAWNAFLQNCKDRRQGR